MSGDYIESILSHKEQVARLLADMVRALCMRAAQHDDSKFSDEEAAAYEEALPKFKDVAYGSPEYIIVCQSIRPAIQHHVNVNRHHPEYFGEDGVSGMNLIDLVEMTCDWIAAAKRSGSDVVEALQVNRKRFGLSDQLYRIILQTVLFLLDAED